MKHQLCLVGADCSVLKNHNYGTKTEELSFGYEV
jgi:hypothetical protein